MSKEKMREIKLLLVDDEADFRQATSEALGRRGFKVTQAESGEHALELTRADHPDVVVLDLRMEGMDGIETLIQLRKEQDDLPVVILTGHGDFEDAWTGIQLDIVDFLQKPVDMDDLAALIRRRLDTGAAPSLKESTISELMLPPSRYDRVYDDQLVREVVEIMRGALSRGGEDDVTGQGHRSVLVFSRQETFIGCLRISDLLQVVVPHFLRDSPYASFFTGMFLAQCKVVGNEPVGELLNDQQTIDIEAPLLKAVHLMVSKRLINLPVLQNGELVGVLRDKDLLCEIALLSHGGSGRQRR